MSLVADKIPTSPLATLGKSRNMGKVAALSTQNFDSAYAKGLMGVSVNVLANRRVRVTASGAEVVDYTRCGYLDLDSNPLILAAAQAAMDEVKSSHFSVARTRLSSEPLTRLEKTLATLFSVDSVVVFPTVAAANMGALPLLAAGLFTNGEKPVIVFDRYAHATLQYHIPVLRDDTEVIIIEHNDLEQLESICKSRKKVAYVGDGAYSMGGAAPVSELRALQEKYGLFIYLDDAHGISVIGERGEGFVRSGIGELTANTIVAASLGKGFGASGGLLMLGSIEMEKVVRRYATTYAFSCAPNTAAVGAALASADLHGTAELAILQDRLRKNLQLFDALIPTETSASPLPIRILRIGDAEESIAKAEFLLLNGHYTSAVFFPTVARGQAAIRVAVTASHDPIDLLELSLLLNSGDYLSTGTRVNAAASTTRNDQRKAYDQ